MISPDFFFWFSFKFLQKTQLIPPTPPANYYYQSFIIVLEFNSHWPTCIHIISCWVNANIIHHTNVHQPNLAIYQRFPNALLTTCCYIAFPSCFSQLTFDPHINSPLATPTVNHTHSLNYYSTGVNYL